MPTAQPHDSLLPVTLLVIGFGVFVGTLISIWHNRHDAATVRAAKTSGLISLAVGSIAFLYLALPAEGSTKPLMPVVLSLLLMLPAFVIVYFCISLRRGIAGAREDQK